MLLRPKRETVDLSRYPDLVVIYLGTKIYCFPFGISECGSTGAISSR